MKIIFLALLAVPTIASAQTKTVVIDESNIQCSRDSRIGNGQTIQARVEADRIKRDWQRAGFKVRIYRVPDGYSFAGKESPDLKVVRPSC